MLIVLLFIFGLLIGSFLNVVILRLPSGSGLGGRSQCPQCGRTLTAFELLPVLSFLVLHGKCKACKARISWRYPLLEISTALLFALAYSVVEPHDLVSWALLVRVLIVIAICIITFVVDFEHYIILNSVTGTGVLLIAIVRIAELFLSPNSWSVFNPFTVSLAAILVAFIPFFLIWWLSRGSYMGFGDVKFTIFMGLALGWPGILVGLLLAFWLGAAVALPLLVMGKKQLQSKLPFGTFLAVATVLAALYGDGLWMWYTHLLIGR